MRLTPFKILCGVGLLALFSSTISKNPSLPLLVANLGGDQAAIGFVAGISSFTGIIVSLPAGFLSDRLGRDRMLIFSGFVFATAPFGYLLVSEIWQLGLIRFYHGMATAVFGPVAMAFVADLHQKDRGGKMGMFSTSTLLGRFAAPAIGGLILGTGCITGNFNFTSLYLICGLTGVLAFLGMILLAKTIPHNPIKSVGSSKGNCFGEMLKPFSNSAILATCLIEASVLFCYGIFETFLPIRGISHGLTPWQIGLCISSQVITIAISKPVLGSFSDRHGRPPQIIAGAFFAALCMMLLAFASTFWEMLVLSILLGLAISTVTSASSAYIADLSQKGSYGSCMGALSSIMDIGHTTGPVVAGITASLYGLTASFICGTSVITGTALYFLWKGRSNGKIF